MYSDKATKWTDAELKALERRIKQEYTKAYNSCKKEMTAIMSRLSEHPEWDAAKRMLEMQKYDRLNNLSNQMAGVLQDTSLSASQFIEKSSQATFRVNYNWNAEKLQFALIDNTQARNILTKNINPFEKLSLEGQRDKSVIMRKLQSELLTSILSGESIRDTAVRIKSVVESDMKKAITTARTEITRVQNSARQSVSDEGKRLGFDMWKEWIATGDNRTREEHANANGQQVPADQPFIVGGEELMYPGDVSLGASPENIVNCRCTMITFIKEKNTVDKK